jgi:thioredoxin 1
VVYINRRLISHFVCFLFLFLGGPCKFIAPKFEELASQETSVTFAKVDVDEAPDVSADQKIHAMPTFKLYKEGVQVAELMGADLNGLIALVAQHK